MIRPTHMGWVVGGLLAAVLVGLIVPAIYQSREAARRTQSRNTLRYLGLAFGNYHDTYSVLPAGGTFSPDGVAFHEWTTSVTPFVDASPWCHADFHVPWDDPRQVDLFRSRHAFPYLMNPSVHLQVRTDGLKLNHYAASQTVMSRNSSQSFKDWDSTAERLLVADALDHHLPLGCPYGWRDVTQGFGKNPDGFGCGPRPFTQCLMGDNSVRDVNNSVAPQVLETMAGPVDQRPSAEQVQKITEYPLLDLSRIWRIERLVLDEFHYTLQRTSPDGLTIMTGCRISDAEIRSAN